MDNFERKLKEQGFKEYEYKPTGFRAWSQSDLCTTENKEWFLI